MTRTFTLMAFALTLGLMPLAAQTVDPATSQSQSAKPHRAWARIAERLKLTESQKTEVQAIKTRHAEASKGLKQDAKTAQKAFHEALRKPETPVAQLRTLHETMQTKAFDLMMDRRAMDSEIRTLLTPEQRIEVDKLQAYRKGMKQGRKGGSKGF